MKKGIYFLVLLFLFGCLEDISDKENIQNKNDSLINSLYHNKDTSTNSIDKLLAENGLSASKQIDTLYLNPINCQYPLHLLDIPLSPSKNEIELNENQRNKLKEIILAYYHNESIVKHTHSLKSIFIRNIQLKDENYTLFVILFDDTEVFGKIAFYNNKTQDFLPKTYGFKLFALYDYSHNQLLASNLKTFFKLKQPEIELTDFNKDGIKDYKFTRLYHNGTFNAIETTILSLKNDKIDTLVFKQEGID